MIFELRQYRTLPGKRDAWVKFAEERIIPSLVAFGIPIIRIAHLVAIASASWIATFVLALWVWRDAWRRKGR